MERPKKGSMEFLRKEGGKRRSRNGLVFLGFGDGFVEIEVEGIEKKWGCVSFWMWREKGLALGMDWWGSKKGWRRRIV